VLAGFFGNQSVYGDTTSCLIRLLELVSSEGVYEWIVHAWPFLAPPLVPFDRMTLAFLAPLVLRKLTTWLSAAPPRCKVRSDFLVEVDW